MLKSLSRTQISILAAAGVALLYLIICYALFASWQNELRTLLEGENRSETLQRMGEIDFPLLLKPLMLPIPATIGNGLFWPFLVQAVFIFAYLVAFIRFPIIATCIIGLAALFVVLLVFGSGLLKGLVAAIIFGVPMLAILSIIGLLINQRSIWRKPDHAPP